MGKGVDGRLGTVGDKTIVKDVKVFTIYLPYYSIHMKSPNEKGKPY